MSKVQTTEDPVTGRKINFVRGVVTKVWFNENKNQKEDWDAFRLVIQMGDTRISSGMVKEERVGVKDADGNYHDLEAGDEISVVVTINGDYVNALPKNIIMMKKGEGQKNKPNQNSPQSGNTTYKKKDNTGMIAGNARNVAFNLVTPMDLDYSEETLLDLLEKVTPIIKEVRTNMESKNTGLDDYEVGFAVGQSALMSSEISSSLEEFKDNLEYFLGDFLFKSIEITKKAYSEDKGGDATPPTKKAPAKTARKTATKGSSTKKVEKTVEEINKEAAEAGREDSQENGDDPDFQEDDIPF